MCNCSLIAQTGYDRLMSKLGLYSVPKYLKLYAKELCYFAKGSFSTGALQMTGHKLHKECCTASVLQKPAIVADCQTNSDY